MSDTDRRLSSGPAERNREPILAVLRRTLPARGRALEIAAGGGQHAVHFAGAMADWEWQPSDLDPSALASIDAWAAHAGLANLRPALRLDVTSPQWPVDVDYDAMLCANMLHIAPWSCCGALMRGAARHLSPKGLLLTYGPYFIEGEDTAPSNLAFDADLRRRDPSWGLRWLHDVVAEAAGAGLILRERMAMPANNQMLCFARP